MTTYAIYTTSTGEIVAVHEGDADSIVLNIDSVTQSYIEFDPAVYPDIIATHYISGGVITTSPVNPSSNPSPSSIVANGTATTTITGIPVGSKITITGPADAVLPDTFTMADSSLAIAAVVPGTYFVYIVSHPQADVTKTFTAT